MFVGIDVVLALQPAWVAWNLCRQPGNEWNILTIMPLVVKDFEPHNEDYFVAVASLIPRGRDNND